MSMSCMPDPDMERTTCFSYAARLKWFWAAVTRNNFIEQIQPSTKLKHQQKRGFWSLQRWVCLDGLLCMSIDVTYSCEKQMQNPISLNLCSCIAGMYASGEF